MSDFLHTIGGKIAAVIAGIFLVFSGGAHTTTNTASSAQPAAAVTALTTSTPETPTQAQAASTNTAVSIATPTTATIAAVQTQAPQTLVVNQTGGVSESALNDRLQALENKLTSLIYNWTGSQSGVVPTSNVSGSIASGGVWNAIAGTNKIDKLSGVDLTSITVNGVSGLTDADIPDGLTASNYFPLTGGTVAGNLTVGGNFTLSGTQTLSGALTIPYLSATSTIASSFIQASTTRLSVFDTAYFGGSSTTTISSAGSITLPSSARLTAPYASTTALTVSGTSFSTYVNGADTAFLFQQDPTVSGTVGSASGNVANTKYGLSFQPTRFTNGPVGETAYIDNNWHWGINGGNNRIDSSKGSLGFSLEDRYYDGTRFGFEAHLQGVADDGVTTFRPWTYFVARDGSYIGGATRGDYYNILSRDGTQMVKFDFESGSKNINISQQTKLVYGVTNVPVATQINAAGNAYKNLPYLGPGDVLQAETPIYVVAARAGASATFPGSFATFQPTSANSGDTILNLAGPTVSGSHNGVVSRTSASGLFKQEFNNQGAGSSEVYVGVEGAGDPYVQFNDLTGRFLVGIDNSDSHKLKISTGSALGTGDVLAIDSSGNVGIATTSPWRKLSVTGTVGFDGLTGSTGAGSLCLSSNKEVVYNSGSDSCLSSTRATKHDIQNLDLDALSLIDLLQPVSFVYNNDASSTVRYGFIAEDAATADSHFATYDSQGVISGIDDRSIISIIVEAIQELGSKIATILNRLSTHDQEIAELKAEVAALKAQVGAVGAVVENTASPQGDIDTKPPTITINGNNPAHINVGDNYSDLGATVSDNVDQNLGYKTYLGSTEMEWAHLETSEPNEWHIHYVAIDNAGNTATSTRTVIVEDPNAAAPDTNSDDQAASSTPIE